MRLLSLFLVATSLLSSCGGDDVAPMGNPVAVDDYCAGYVDALCAAAARCGCMIDDAACRSAAGGACVLDRGRPTREMVDTGALPYDEAAAGAYLAAIEASACTERPSLCGTTGPCLGLASVGGACGQTSGCQGGLACVGGTCREPGPDGATCSTGAECTSGRCERSECSAAAGLGEACSEESACASGNCDFATGRCRDKEPLEALCTEHSECESRYCDRDLALGAGNCRPLEPLGGACDEDPMCGDGACFSGVCGPALCDDLM